MNKEETLCAFCCKRQATTRDHIPPKCLYPKSVRQGLNLITVPSCIQCNNELSDSEEHFRNIIVTGGGRNFIVDELFEKVVRGLERAKGNYKVTDFLDAMQKHQFSVENGQERHIIYPDETFWEVMSKIGRGLFYHHMDFPLPSSYLVETKKLEFLVPPGLWNASDCYHCQSQIFRYGYSRIEDGKGWVWIINLFETRTFFQTMLPV